MKTKRNRGKQRNLNSKRSGECSDYKFKDTFFYSTNVKDWYESKSKISCKKSEFVLIMRKTYTPPPGSSLQGW